VTDAVTVRVDGGEEFARTARHAADQLGDMERAGDRAATLIANRGRTEAPRLSGALASSITPDVDGNVAAVVSSLPYANRTHWGYARYGQRAQPFLSDPLVSLEGTYVAYYADEADRVLHTVRGA
jgi:phage gpG-like protein